MQINWKVDQNRMPKGNDSTLVLSESRFLRYLNFSLLYIAQGIPEGITYFAIPAWLAMHKESPVNIAAFVGVIGIPWSFKIIMAPVIDRFTILAMGRKRPWIIFGQLGLIVSFLSLAFIHNPVGNLNALMLSGFFISFFGAFQDIATDGMAIDIIPAEQQAQANGLMWGSKVIGTSASLVLGTFLINEAGLSVAVTVLSTFIGGIMLAPIFFRERPGEKLMPWSKGKPSEINLRTQAADWKSILRSVLKILPLRSSIIISIAIFIVGMFSGLADTTLPIFTIQRLKWTNTLFSHLYSITTIVSGLLGMFASGYLLRKFGGKRMMATYFVILAMLLAGFGLSGDWWSNRTFVYAFVLLYYLLYVFLTIAVYAMAMRLCSLIVAATQFTFYMALINLGRAAGSAMTGYLHLSFSWSEMFIIIAVLPLVCLSLLPLINFNRHA